MNVRTMVKGRAMTAVLAILTQAASFVNPLLAQTTPDTGVAPSTDAIPKFSYGVRASFNVTTFTGEAADSPNSGGRPGAGLRPVVRAAAA